MRRLLLFFSFSITVFAANQRLYLKDGDYQMVREYQVEGERVRYFSVERGGWEEIPTDLVDLKKTEKDAADKAAAMAEVLEQEKAEDAAIQADRKLLAEVPQNVGPYLIEGQKLTKLDENKVTIEDSKSRRILQVLAPAPIIAGKSTVTVEGKAAKVRLTEPLPEFYFRLEQEERLAIVKLDVKKNERVVETVDILPNEQGTLENFKLVPTFKKQYGPQLHKIWPEQPLEPGEYALVEYTEGQVNVRVWEFGVDKAPRK
jgi:hypothetical protein